jgi:hypothetical protein
MSKSIIGLAAMNTSSGFGQTNFFALMGSTGNTTTETRTNPKFRTAGTLSNVAALIPTNTVNGTSTLKVRQNAVDSTLSVSITASTTGVFEDVTHSLSVVAGDNIGYALTTGGSSGSLTFSNATISFDAAANTVTRLISNDTPSSYALNATANFSSPGFMALNATEAKRQCKINAAGTLTNLYVRVLSNSRTTSTSFKTRINGVDGVLAISVSAGTTGEFEDTTHSDTIAAGDLVCWSILGGAETTAITFSPVAFSFVSTAGLFVAAASNTLSQGASTNRYAVLSQGPSSQNVEGNSKSRIKEAVTFSKLSVYVSTGPSLNCTTTVRKNGVATSLSVTLLASTTGWFTDSSNTATFAAGDDFSILTACPASGGTLVTESIAYIGTTSSGLALTLSIADSIACTETRSGSDQIPKIDSFSMADSKLASAGLAKTESVTLSDVRAASSVLAKADTIATSDSAAKANAIVKADGFGLVDAKSNASGTIRTETISVTDTIAALIIFIRQFSDGLTIIDAYHSTGSDVISFSHTRTTTRFNASNHSTQFHNSQLTTQFA